MSRIASRKAAQMDSNEVDLTPMLDVVFIMLIFFIVTAAFVREVGIDADRPAGDASQSDVKPIVFEMTASGEIHLENRRIDILSVRANTSRLLAETPEAGVIVRAAPGTRTESFTPVIDFARAAGARNVALLIRKN